MLSKIYVDNFKCLVNFTLELDGLTILHGDNGSGKSAVIDALRAIRSLLRDECKVGEAFPPDTKARFEHRTEQHFILDFKSEDDMYSYSLVVNQPPDVNPDNLPASITSESLRYNDTVLFDFSDGMAQLYGDEGRLGAKTPLKPFSSTLAMVHPRPFNQRLQWFRDQFSRLLVMHLEPGRMSADFDPEVMELADNGCNFPSWWFNKISGENSQLIPGLYEKLGEVIEGFRAITLQEHRAGKRFAALIEKKENSNGAYKYGINELSDGERVLLVLYSLLYGVEPGSHVLCLDEPDNFVSLPELYPWLAVLDEMCADNGQQALLISHHPEFYDFMGGRRSIWLKREANAPTRVIDRPQYPADEDKQGLKLSELVARRWLK